MPLRLERFVNILEEQKKREFAQLVLFNDTLNAEAEGIFGEVRHLGLPVVLPAIRDHKYHPNLRYYQDLGITHWELGPRTIMEQYYLLREISATPLDLISTFKATYSGRGIRNRALASCITRLDKANNPDILDPIISNLATHLSNNFQKAAIGKGIWAELIIQDEKERRLAVYETRDLVYLAGFEDLIFTDDTTIQDGTYLVANPSST